MHYKKNEKLQLLLHRKTNQKNVESIVNIFIQTMEATNFYNALDMYMTLHIISNWYYKNDVKNYPCITPKLERTLDTLYWEIKWKSESKNRRLTTNMVFINFNNESHSIKEIYEMLEDQQDPYYNVVIQRVKTFLSD